MKQKVQALLRWWLNGLLLPLPTAWRPGAPRPRLLARLESKALHCAHINRHGATLEARRFEENEESADPPSSHDKTPANPLAWVRTRQQQGLPLTLLLAPGQGLCTTLRLPSAARANLAQVIRFEMDRQTPFKVSEVCYDFRLAEEYELYLLVELALAPKRILEPALERIRAWELRPTTVDLDDGEGHGMGFNLMPATTPERNGTGNGFFARLGQGFGLTRGLALLVLLLAAGSLYAPLPRLAERTQQLERQAAALTSEAAQVRKLEEHRRTLSHGGDFLEQASADRPHGLEILLRITRLVPDDSWLERLELEGNALRLQGSTPAASKLLQSFEASTLFRDSRFLAPLTRVTQDLERFSLGATVILDRKQNTDPEVEEPTPETALTP